MKTIVKRILLAASLLAAVGLFVFNLAKPVPIVVPTPVMPNPNAYDFFVRAGDVLVHDNLIYDPKTNITHFLSENAAALKIVRQGFVYPCLHPPVRGAPTSADFAKSTKLRHLGRLLMMEGTVKSAAGNWFGAANSDVDAIELGVDINQGAPLLENTDGTSCEALGRANLWDSIDHLNAAQVHAITSRLNSLLQRKMTYGAMLMEEKWFGIDLRLRTLSSKPNIMSIIWSKQAVIRSYAKYMDSMIAQSALPFSQSRLPLPSPRDPWNAMWGPIYERAKFPFWRNDTEDSLLLTTLALRAYFRDHNAYPNSLNNLIPTYLKSIPVDPLGTGPFKYRTTGKSYLLYSIGPDGVDNGGKPIDDPTRVTSPRARYFAREESKGDIVAGINR